MEKKDMHVCIYIYIYLFIYLHLFTLIPRKRESVGALPSTLS